MLLQDIQHYLQHHSPASLHQLSVHFNLEADALRPMLQRLVRKGRINRQAVTACGSCHHCEPGAIEWYTWPGSPSLPTDNPTGAAREGAGVDP